MTYSDLDRVALPSGVIVLRESGVMSDKIYIYTAYEPTKDSDSDGANNHSTVVLIDGIKYGNVASVCLPAEIKNLPVGDQRYEKVLEFYEYHHERAHASIVEAYPEAISGFKLGGSIEVYIGL